MYVISFFFNLSNLRPDGLATLLEGLLTTNSPVGTLLYY